MAKQSDGPRLTGTTTRVTTRQTSQPAWTLRWVPRFDLSWTVDQPAAQTCNALQSASDPPGRAARRAASKVVRVDPLFEGEFQAPNFRLHRYARDAGTLRAEMVGRVVPTSNGQSLVEGRIEFPQPGWIVFWILGGGIFIAAMLAAVVGTVRAALHGASWWMPLLPCSGAVFMIVVVYLGAATYRDDAVQLEADARRAILTPCSRSQSQ